MKFLFTISLILLTYNTSKSQSLDPFEVEIRNTSGVSDIYLKLSPVGAIFNANNQNLPTGAQGLYSRIAYNQVAPAGVFNIDGGIKKFTNQSGHQSVWLNHDVGSFGYDEFRPLNMSVGWGKYKIEFGTIDYIDSIHKGWIALPGDSYGYIDFNDGSIGYSPYFLNIDIYIYLKFNTNRNYYITFQFAVGSAQEVDITDNRLENRTIKMWHQVGTFQNNQWDPIFVGSPRKGVYYSDTSSSNEEFPIDATRIISIDGAQIPLIHETPGIFSNSILNVYHNSLVQTNKVLSFKNSDFIVKNNITFNFLSNSNFQIDNSSSSFQTSVGSNIYTPQNYSLSISNGAYINSRGSTFSSSSIWNGIKLENTGYDTIINCTFNNAKTAISITNDNLINNPNIIIRKNIFNISQDNGRGIEARNLNKILIDSNTFNFSNSNSTLGIYFRNSNSAGGGQRYFSYNLNIVNNKFYNGYLPIYISGLTSARTPFYVYNNIFYGTNTYSIVGLKITGDIKNNRFDVNNNSRSIGLWNSNPNVFGNSFNSVSTNMYLNYSFPALAPYPNSSDQLVWSAGRNSFYSVEKENIYLAGSYPCLNNGSNTFTINDTYHIFGSIPDSVNDYYMKYNCWNGYNEIPKYFLYKYINDTTIQNISAHYTPIFCDEEPSTVTTNYTDKGSGIIDTTLITGAFNIISLPEDESMLGQARMSNWINNFPDAIINYKGLINNYAGSEWIYTSLYEMYDNYSALDTSGDQTVIDVLFGDLKQYLQGRISSANYSEDFESLSFDVILMCETRMKNLEVALTGYEFIALYHPNAEQRMLASWDYEEIEEMINGSGGGEKQLGIRNEELRIEELEINELNRLDKLIDDDPLLKTLKKNYEKNNALERKIKSDKVTENNLNQRAKENIFKAKFLNKEEKEKRYMEDLKLLMMTENTDSKNIESKITKPKGFILNQNYPNPFNPTTNISYFIPVSSFVTLKIFDITGKEIVTLVNEYKENGSYQVTFNGINLPSGVYYFRIKSGEWNQVRKMLFIK